MPVMKSAARKEDERGAVLVFTALLLVGMMGFAAIAVDAAAAWSEKREVQTSADMGSLAAIQEIPRTLLADAIANSASAGSDFVTRNADATPTVGEPTAGPSCSARPPGFTRPCITNVAVSSDGSSDNSFAPAIGAAAAIDVPASAEAQIDIEYPEMKLFPIGVSSTAAGLRCSTRAPGIDCLVHDLDIENLPVPLPDPVPTIPIGSHDMALAGLFRIDTGCDLVEDTTIANLLDGADHLVDDDTTAPALEEPDACNRGHELTLPNIVRPNLPPVASILTGGIEPKLGGSNLWEFLNPGVGACSAATFALADVVPDPEIQFTLKTLLMELCIQSGGASFSLGSNDRLGWALVLSEERITGYVPVWIHSLVDPLPEPIVTLDPSGEPTGFTVFVLEEVWLDPSLVEVDPGGVDNLTFKLVS